MDKVAEEFGLKVFEERIADTRDFKRRSSDYSSLAFSLMLEVRPDDEEWRKVPGYEDRYEISSHGLIKSIPTDAMKAFGHGERYLNPSPTTAGYIRIALARNDVKRRVLLHRLIAELFLDNDDPENKIHVNHKNRNKLDNRVRNLEWCTPRENIVHFTGSGGRYKNKRAVVMDPGTPEEAHFDSIAEAGRQTGISSRKIGDCCRGRHSSVSGHHFCYSDSSCGAALEEDEDR